MIAFLTGGTGFIGSLLAESLIDRGWQVYCLIRKTSSLQWLKHLPVELIEGNLFQEATYAAPIAKATHIFHLAGLTKALTPEEYYRANANGTRAILQACAQHAKGIRRFVYVSSIAAAGPSPDGTPVTEADETHPVSIYGRTKLEGEKACLEFQNIFPVSIIRPPVVYGPRDRDVFEYFKQIRYGIRLQLGTVERRTSIVHVHDLVRGLIEIAQHPDAAGETFFVCNPQPYNWAQLGDAIARSMNKRTATIRIPEWIVPAVANLSELAAKLTNKPALLNTDKVEEMKQPFWVCSPAKALEKLGFSTSLTLQAGMEMTTAWYKQNGWL